MDNAIEATEGKGRILVATEYDRGGGPRAARAWPTTARASRPPTATGSSCPHFSTKKRGSGLGLAIVSRIVQEHHGTIRAEDNAPRGARFVVELPA